MERVLLKEEVPGVGVTCGVGIDRRRRHRKGNNKEGRTMKPKGGEVAEEVPGDGATSGVGVDRPKRHRKGNKKEGRTKKPKGGEVADEALNPKSGEEMPASKEKGGKKRKLVTLRSPMIAQEALVDEMVHYMVCEPRNTPSESDIIDLDWYPELEEAAAYYQKRREFIADIFRQYRTKGYADVELEVHDDEL